MDQEQIEILKRPKKNKTLMIIGIVVAVHVALITSVFVVQEINKRGEKSDQALLQSGKTPTAPENALKTPEQVQQPAVSQPVSMAQQPKAAVVLPVKVAQATAVKPQVSVQPHPAVIPNTVPIKLVAAKAVKTVNKTYVVQKGDTWQRVASKWKVNAAQLAKDNGLDTKKFLRIGQKLVIKQTVETAVVAVAATTPKAAIAKATAKVDVKTAEVKTTATKADIKPIATPAVVTKTTEVKTVEVSKLQQATIPSMPSVLYEVKKGDTLGMIATQHAMHLSDLKAINGLKDDKIAVGQKLKVLQPGPKPVTQSLLVGVEPRDSAPQVHVVSKGETVTVIAKKYGVSTSELLRVNQIADPTKIGIGKRLKIPLMIITPKQQDLRQVNSDDEGTVKPTATTDLARLDPPPTR